MKLNAGRSEGKGIGLRGKMSMAGCGLHFRVRRSWWMSSVLMCFFHLTGPQVVSSQRYSCYPCPSS